MAVPDFQTFMLPVLRQFADGSERRSSDIRAPLAVEFDLTPDEIAQRFARGVHTVFGNRIAWALGYLRQARILESPRRGVYVITQRAVVMCSRRRRRELICNILINSPNFGQLRRPMVNLQIVRCRTSWLTEPLYRSRQLDLPLMSKFTWGLRALERS